MFSLLCILASVPTTVGTRTQTASRSLAPDFESICNIVEVMTELRSSFDEWQKNDTATLKGEKDRYTVMKREKESALRKAKDNVAEAKEDFDSLDTEAKDLDVQVEATKKGLMSVKSEVKALTDKLRAKRQEYRDKEASLSASASAASSALMEQMVSLKKASRDVNKLSALSSQLQVPSSKTSLRQKTMALRNNAGLARLQKQPAKFQEQAGELKKEYRTEEQEMEKLVEAKQKDIKSLQDDLERLNAEYGGKQEETALVQRDIQNNERTLERDEKVLTAATEEWTKKEGLLSKYKELRLKIIQNIGSAIGALQGSGCSVPASFAEIGVSTVPSKHVVPLWQSRPAAPLQSLGPMSFVQMNAETSDEALLAMGGALASGGDPFADVKDKITQLITALKQKINEDMGKQDFCDNEKARADEELAAKREDLDVLTANIRQLKTALAKSNDDSAFAENEVGRLSTELGRLQEARALGKSKVLTMKKEHQMAVQVLDQSIEILRKFYNLPEGAEPSKSQQGITGQALIDIMIDTKKLIGELSAMLDSGDGELDILSGALVKDCTDAKAARETERDDLVTAKAEQASNLADTEADLKSLEGELKLMVEAQDQLAAECGPQKVDPEARAKARDEEIQGLQDALKVLAGEDIPLSAAASMLQLDAPQNQNSRAPSTLMAAIQGGGGDESVLQQLQHSLRAAAGTETNWQNQLASIQ
jgi:chromosome segregation ATPase